MSRSRTETESLDELNSFTTPPVAPPYPFGGDHTGRRGGIQRSASWDDGQGSLAGHSMATLPTRGRSASFIDGGPELAGDSPRRDSYFHVDQAPVQPLQRRNAVFNLATLGYEFEDDNLTQLDKSIVVGRLRKRSMVRGRGEPADEPGSAAYADHGAEASREELSKAQVLRQKLRLRMQDPLLELRDYVRQSWEQFVPTVLFAVVLGVVCGLVGIGGEYASRYLLWCRTVMVRDLGDWAGGYWTNWAIWMTFTLLLSGAAMVIGNLTPECTGGGTAELRAMMSGRIMPHIFSVRVLVSKYVGVLLSNGGGLIAGKQGPMGHICAAISYQLMKIPLFRRFSVDAERRYEMLGAGISVSSAANFMVPFAGTLWGYEFSSSHATIRMYWISFVASVAAVFVFRMLYFGTTYLTIDYPRNVWRWDDMPLFALVGVLCGVLSSVQVRLLELLIQVRKRLSQGGTSSAQKTFFWLMSHPLVYGFAVTGLTGVATYPGTYGYLGLGGRQTLLQLWSPKPLKSLDGGWGQPSVLQALALFFVTRYVLFTLTSVIPAPVGTFSPCLWVGAVVGRFVGEVLVQVSPERFVDFAEPTDDDYSGVFPAIFAMVGSGAYTSSFTKTLSVSLFVLELSGQYQLMVPSMVGCIAAFITQNYLADSFYDMACRMRRLPFVPPVPDILRDVSVGSFMTTDFWTLHRSAPRETLINVLHVAPTQRYFPVLSDSDSAVIGFTSRREILAYLATVAKQEEELEKEGLDVDGGGPMTQFVGGLAEYDMEEATVATHPHGFRVFGKHGRSAGGGFQVQPIPVMVQVYTPLTLIHHLVIRYEQPVTLVTDEFGRLAGMVTREQVTAAIGYRSYFRVLRGVVGRILHIFAESALPDSRKSWKSAPVGGGSSSAVSTPLEPLVPMSTLDHSHGGRGGGGGGGGNLGERFPSAPQFFTMDFHNNPAHNAPETTDQKGWDPVHTKEVHTPAIQVDAALLSPRVGSKRGEQLEEEDFFATNDKYNQSSLRVSAKSNPVLPSQMVQTQQANRQRRLSVNPDLSQVSSQDHSYYNPALLNLTPPSSDVGMLSDDDHPLHGTDPSVGGTHPTRSNRYAHSTSAPPSDGGRDRRSVSGAAPRQSSDFGERPLLAELMASNAQGYASQTLASTAPHAMHVSSNLTRTRIATSLDPKR